MEKINWLAMSACDLGRDIGNGRIDPVALTDAYLDAIDGHPARDRIFVRVMHERARSEAMAAAKRAKDGTRRSLLDGVPISWKDLFDSAGVATEAGSALLAGRVPESDAEVLANATRAGLVCLGKTHMTELAFSGLGLNPNTATPPNVWDAERAPGGSSSGAATSVAFGLAAAGIGSDTGGSVRAPSGWNGLVGLKTTHGMLSNTGVVPLCPRFDTVGPLCRTVEDAGYLTFEMDGEAPPDLEGAELAGLRFLVLTNPVLAPIDDEPQAAFEAAVSRLSAKGAHISQASLPEVEEAMALAGCLFATEAYATWKDEIEAHPGRVYRPVEERFRSGAAFSGVDYVQAWARLEQLRAQYLDSVAGFDAVLIPNCPIIAPKTADLLADDAYFSEKNLATLRNTRVGNLMGLCALTLPTGEDYCALMAMGTPFGERKLLRVGAAIEKSLG